MEKEDKYYCMQAYLVVAFYTNRRNFQVPDVQQGSEYEEIIENSSHEQVIV